MPQLDHDHDPTCEARPHAHPMVGMHMQRILQCPVLQPCIAPAVPECAAHEQLSDQHMAHKLPGPRLLQPD